MDFRAIATAGAACEPEVVDVVDVTHPFPNARAERTELTTSFTGGHLIHAAIAGCVLNDVYREAQTLGITIDGVRVEAWGGFDGDPTESTGVEYTVEIESPADDARVAELVARVDEIAEIPSVLRTGAAVTRVAPPGG